MLANNDVNPFNDYCFEKYYESLQNKKTTISFKNIKRQLSLISDVSDDFDDAANAGSDICNGIAYLKKAGGSFEDAGDSFEDMKL